MKVKGSFDIGIHRGVFVDGFMGRSCLITWSLLGVNLCRGDAPDNQPSAKSPLESLDCMHVPPAFKAGIVAAEPLIENPVAFEWGADGRA
jgi:hypothetical protein